MEILHISTVNFKLKTVYYNVKNKMHDRSKDGNTIEDHKIKTTKTKLGRDLNGWTGWTIKAY